MIRKFVIAAAAIAALGTASLVATPANAGGGGKGGGWGGGGFHHHHHGFRSGIGFGLYPVVDSCYKDVLVTNRRGETYIKTVYVCN